jgi:hypothetical protein
MALWNANFFLKAAESIARHLAWLEGLAGMN